LAEEIVDKKKWDGKTKGSFSGIKIFIFLIKKLGLNSAYFLLVFVAFWFAIFSRKGSKAQFYFFRERLKYPFFKSLISVYKNNFTLGQVLIDKVAILSGLKHKFTTEHTNSEVIENMIKNKTGGILVNAHVGSWEIAGQLLDRYNGKIYLVMLVAEHEKIKELFSSVTEQKIEIIPIKEDGTHLLKINEVLEDKGIIAMHGDRFVEGAQTIKQKFLGEYALFPSGPFRLAAKYNVPISFATAFREKNRHYHFFAMKPIYVQNPGNLKKRKEEINKSMKVYLSELEKMIKKYPMQWFNYYQFWEDNKKI